jgi:UDP-2-acetamido-2,6-beta-L-arabino-hexul-4-ose reductase
MIKIAITGASGFIGKNLFRHLSFRDDVQVEMITRDDTRARIIDKLKDVQLVYHLAGINRPVDESEFHSGNVEFTAFLLDTLASLDHPVKFVISSSAQAELDNPYGRSKKQAEELVVRYSHEKNIEGVIYRLPGVFGKWCKPNYNSVVATFCHNIAQDLPISINDPDRLLTLVYIDDVVSAFIAELTNSPVAKTLHQKEIGIVYHVSLKELAEIIGSFKKTRYELLLPEIGNPLIKKLYSTYLSYLPVTEFSYPLPFKSDNRGNLFELLKSPGFGQIFISTTHPGVVRGNHFHHTKTEKFCVIKGTGLITFRQIDSAEIIEYKVSGEQPIVVDIPPGYTHNITNIGTDEMITLFWANEIFDVSNPDTHSLKV